MIDPDALRNQGRYAARVDAAIVAATAGEMA
jgi:hypothetical protein